MRKIIYISMCIIIVVCSLTGCKAKYEDLPIAELGKPITLNDNLEFKLKAVMLFENIELHSVKAPEVKEGMKRVVFIFDVKNLSKADLILKDKISFELLRNDKVENNNTEFFSEEKKYSIKSLQSEEFYGYVEVPNEVTKDPNLLKPIIILNHDKYVYSGLVENAYSFINDVNKEIETTLEVVKSSNKISNEVTDEMNNLLKSSVNGNQKYKELLIQSEEAHNNILVAYQNLINNLNKLDAPAFYEQGIKDLIRSRELFIEGYTASEESEIRNDAFGEADIFSVKASKELPFLESAAALPSVYVNKIL